MSQQTPGAMNAAMYRPLYLNGACNQGMESMTTGAILVGLALQLGASNFVIGVLAAIPFLTNLFQLPAVFLIDRIGDRKRIVTYSSTIGRSLLMLALLVPWLGAGDDALMLLVAIMCGRYACGAITACAWNSWMRDLIPAELLGRYMGQRMFIMTIVAVVVGLAGGLAVEHWSEESARLQTYAVIFALGSVAGLLGARYALEIPHPHIEAYERRAIERNLHWSRFRAPFAHANFRRLMAFLCAWNFAANLATPFFTAYMLTTLGYELSFVIVLTLFSQAVTAVSLRIWGRYADRYSHKTVLGVCCSLFLLCFLGWTFVSFPDRHTYTAQLLFVLHAVMGIATAGVNLSTNSMALKLVPKREATSYLAVNSMMSSLAAGIAPLLGGLFADFFARQQLSLLVRWQDTSGRMLDINTLSLGHWDFFFGIAFFVGLYALHRLSLVHEEGQLPQGVMVRDLLTDTGQVMRSFASVDGMRDLVSSPFTIAINLLKRQANPAQQSPELAAVTAPPADTTASRPQ